jgi:hypothetical protein
MNKKKKENTIQSEQSVVSVNDKSNDDEYSLEDLYTFSDGFDPLYEKYQNEENNDNS